MVGTFRGYIAEPYDAQVLVIDDVPETAETARVYTERSASVRASELAS